MPELIHILKERTRDSVESVCGIQLLKIRSMPANFTAWHSRATCPTCRREDTTRSPSHPLRRVRE